MTVRIILTLNLFYKPLCIIKSSDQDLTESELLYLFKANEPFLIFRDSFYEFTDSRKPVFQGFPVCSVADSHGMRFFEAVAWCNECACLMIHITAEVIGVHRKIVVDKRSRTCLRTYVGNMRFTLDPRIKDGKVFTDQSPVA